MTTETTTTIANPRLTRRFRRSRPSYPWGRRVTGLTRAVMVLGVPLEGRARWPGRGQAVAVAYRTAWSAVRPTTRGPASSSAPPSRGADDALDNGQVNRRLSMPGQLVDTSRRSVNTLHAVGGSVDERDDRVRERERVARLVELQLVVGEVAPDRREG